jgi:hypothetical protein
MIHDPGDDDEWDYCIVHDSPRSFSYIQAEEGGAACLLMQELLRLARLRVSLPKLFLTV